MAPFVASLTSSLSRFMFIGIHVPKDMGFVTNAVDKPVSDEHVFLYSIIDNDFDEVGKECQDPG